MGVMVLKEEKNYTCTHLPTVQASFKWRGKARHCERSLAASNFEHLNRSATLY
jgi:hypothetical protein